MPWSQMSELNSSKNTVTEPPANGETVAWRALLAEAIERLTQAGIPHAPGEARWILETVSGMAMTDLMRDFDSPVSVRQVSWFDVIVARRAAHEPLQYVLGSWAFRHLDLFVDQRVLIPRPETESLVDLVLAHLATVDRKPRIVADLGTGSGAIALSVAREAAAVSVWATDRSEGALSVARANLAGIGVRGAAVSLAQGDWFEALPTDLRSGIDVVVSNPPYVPRDAVLETEVFDHEPHEALFSGDDGLDDLRVIVHEAPGWLSEQGALMCECDPEQMRAIRELCKQAGFASCTVHRDLTGRDRLFVATVE